jgi:hypothetical protein
MLKKGKAKQKRIDRSELLPLIEIRFITLEWKDARMGGHYICTDGKEL